MPWRAHLLTTPLRARGVCSRVHTVLDNYKGHAFSDRVSVPLLWRDMDAMGHVNHTLFLAYFEQARAEIWSANGLVLHGKGEAPILKSLTAEFKATLTFPDVVTMGVRTVELSQREYAQFYACVSHASGRVVATGTARFVNFDYDAGRPSARLCWQDKCGVGGGATLETCTTGDAVYQAQRDSFSFLILPFSTFFFKKNFKHTSFLKQIYFIYIIIDIFIYDMFFFVTCIVHVQLCLFCLLCLFVFIF